MFRPYSRALRVMSYSSAWLAKMPGGGLLTARDAGRAASAPAPAAGRALAAGPMANVASARRPLKTDTAERTPPGRRSADMALLPVRAGGQRQGGSAGPDARS